MNVKQFSEQYPRVTRRTVDLWLLSHRPHLATHETGAAKGTYRKDAGPAASFNSQGGTWREVLMAFAVDAE